MTMKKGLLLSGSITCIIFFFFAFASGCMYTTLKKENGPMKRESRETGPFTGIKVGGVFEVTLIQAPVGSVEVEAPTALMEKIKTEVEDGILVISTTAELSTDSALHITLHMPLLTKIECSGASQIHSTNVFTCEELELACSGANTLSLETQAKKITAKASGAGNIRLKGQTTEMQAEITGAASLKSFGLETEKADVQISGAGNAEVSAKNELSGTISGAGNIIYSGDPAINSVKASGAGSIHRNKKQ
jgi:hypothetical protein